MRPKFEALRSADKQIICSLVGRFDLTGRDQEWKAKQIYDAIMEMSADCQTCKDRKTIAVFKPLGLKNGMEVDYDFHERCPVCNPMTQEKRDAIQFGKGMLDVCKRLEGYTISRTGLGMEIQEIKRQAEVLCPPVALTTLPSPVDSGTEIARIET